MANHRPLVIIESPYAGDVECNIEYARRCMLDSLTRGEAPIASHLLYTQPGVLDDNNPSDRRNGIDAGHAWYSVAEVAAVYTDLGMTRGMADGVCAARKAGAHVVYRKIDNG